MLLIGAVASSSAAEAATIILSTDKTHYDFGETIILTVTATNAAETDSGITGVVLFDTAYVDPTPGGATQTPLVSLGGAVTWTQGALAAFCTDASGSCRMFSQISPVGAQSVSSPASPFVLSTKTFVMGTLVGSFSFTWLASPATPVAQRLDYFGVTNAPGVSITVIPEPGTVLLVGLGLLGLAAASRRRATRDA